jgi:hypothetical protein
MEREIPKVHGGEREDPGVFTAEDRKVIVDAFLERLPAVWLDAQEEVVRGKPLAEVVKEMRDGHILRVLKRAGWDPEEFINDFQEYMSNG